MNTSKAFIGAALLVGVASVVSAQQPAAPPQLPQAPNMTFFVTGSGPGKGADLGGLEGADTHCQTLAARHGAGGKTWRAYLSTQEADGKPAVNARDRVGNGPWQNFKGTVVAASVDDLHSDNNKLGFDNSLSERGQLIPGSGYAPNRHDVLTGSTMEGRAFPAGEDRTCKNWTSSTQGAAMVGHIDRKGVRDTVEQRSWNAAHPSRTRRRLQPERSARHRRRRAVLLLREQLARPENVCDEGRAKARPSLFGVQRCGRHGRA